MSILAAFTVATALFFHRNFADQNQMIHFLKNFMIVGGLLQIVHFGAGAVSLDNRTRSRTPSENSVSARSGSDPGLP
jgi:putative oxidoreductase